MSTRSKAIVKSAVKNLASAAGCVIPAASGSRILMYHSVGRREHEMNVRPEEFREQMAWLAEHGTPISLRDAMEGRPGVAVTFDDGYLDNLTEAAPVLNEFGIPATVYVVAGRLGGFLDHDAPEEAAQLMTWDQVRELESMGITIGAHTLTHARLSKCSESVQRDEIVGCARLMEDQLQHPIESFAYPFGTSADYNECSRGLVRDGGFRCACSARYGVNVPSRVDPWALRRIWIDRTDSMAVFRRKVLGRLDLLNALDSRLALRFRRILNRVPRDV
ncbi:MAG: polysaccharide deacetylase family protein [Candidatus Hydrogenedentes bacterium]|nr:polysaccharide deacetylase family protein [Candidatus Hydrogenedentota bacterium]